MSTLIKINRLRLGGAFLEVFFSTGHNLLHSQNVFGSLISSFLHIDICHHSLPRILASFFDKSFLGLDECFFCLQILLSSLLIVFLQLPTLSYKTKSYCIQVLKSFSAFALRSFFLVSSSIAFFLNVSLLS